MKQFNLEATGAPMLIEMSDPGREGSLKTARRTLARTNLRGRRALASTLVQRAKRRGAAEPERLGVTVVTVTWNSLDFLRELLIGVRTFSQRPVEILVIDNHSSDGTAEFLREQADVRTVTTPINIGHGLGVDLAFANARTTDVVVLDVDAFPISDLWLSTVLDPLEAGATVAGAYVQRSFIHPSYLAMRRRDYFRLNASFVPIGVRTASGDRPRGLFMDVGEALSHGVAVTDGSNALHRIAITQSSGAELIGSVYGDVVYHNFYSTQGRPEMVQAAKQAWHAAVNLYLPS